MTATTALVNAFESGHISHLEKFTGGYTLNCVTDKPCTTCPFHPYCDNEIISGSDFQLAILSHPELLL